jgi:hypothetical protein
LEHIPRKPPEGYKEEGQVTVMAKKKVKIDHFLIFFQTIFSEKDVLEIIFSLICTMTLTRKATLHSLESVEKMCQGGYCFVNLI